MLLLVRRTFPVFVVEITPVQDFTIFLQACLSSRCVLILVFASRSTSESDDDANDDFSSNNWFPLTLPHKHLHQDCLCRSPRVSSRSAFRRDAGAIAILAWRSIVGSFLLGSPTSVGSPTGVRWGKVNWVRESPTLYPRWFSKGRLISVCFLRRGDNQGSIGQTRGKAAEINLKLMRYRILHVLDLEVAQTR